MVGPAVRDLAEAGTSADVALAGRQCVAAWPDAPRPVLADALLPERALAGDTLARLALVSRTSSSRSPRPAATCCRPSRCCAQCGGSIEGSARALFVHAEHGALPTAPGGRRDRPQPDRPARRADPAGRAHARPARGRGHPAVGEPRPLCSNPPTFPAKRRACRPAISRRAGDRLEPVLAIIAPGQGAQTPGFLTPWLDVPGFADRLRWYSRGDRGGPGRGAGPRPARKTIRDTAVAQPLLVAAGIAASASTHVPCRRQPPTPGESPRTRQRHGPPERDLRPAGRGVASPPAHSVGEITAATIASLLSPETAMVFVSERGREMARAAASTATGMTAVLGGEPEEVLAQARRPRPASPPT